MTTALLNTPVDHVVALCAFTLILVVVLWRLLSGTRPRGATRRRLPLTALGVGPCAAILGWSVASWSQGQHVASDFWIALENLPYWLLLGVAGGVVVAFTIVTARRSLSTGVLWRCFGGVHKSSRSR